MSTAPAMTLEDAIRQSGEGWLIEWHEPPTEAMDHLRRTLEAVHRRAQERFGASAPDLSEAAVVEEFHRNPQRVKGFFQALGSTQTPEMLLMAWRITQGMEIKSIELSYLRQAEFRLRVILKSPYDVEDAPYDSTDIHDFALLRHVGILEISGKPVFDGFYPLRVRES